MYFTEFRIAEINGPPNFLPAKTILHRWNKIAILVAMDIMSLLIGLVAGFLTGLILFLIYRSKTVPKADYNQLAAKNNELQTELRLTTERLNQSREESRNLLASLKAEEQKADQLQVELTTVRTNIRHQERSLTELREAKQQQTELAESLQDEVNRMYRQIAELTVTNRALNEKMATQKQEILDLQRNAQLQFEKIAQQIFEEKSSKFTETNKANLEQILNPLKEDIGKFKTKVEETYDKESRQRFSLEQRVKELIEQTNKVSNEANNLATALKGQTKKQGDWGEMILERILEGSGLTRNREYFMQEAFQSEDGKLLRPDVTLKLPDNRVIIIDSKVSLVAYDRYSSADTTEDQNAALNEHLASIRNHIDSLSSKHYDNLNSSLDFTMMFIPIEPAYLLAIQRDQNLWNYAYKKRILLVSPTNLIACLKLISDLWNREKQSKNAQEIVKRGEQLYNKVVDFVSAMEDLGKHIEKSQTVYRTAIDRLKSGKGNVIWQAVQLKSLGLKSHKQISENMMPYELDDTEPNPDSNHTEAE